MRTEIRSEHPYNLEHGLKRRLMRHANLFRNIGTVSASPTLIEMQQNGHTTVSSKIETTVVCNGPGFHIATTALRLMRHLVVFEIDDPDCILRTSEVLEDFNILINDRPVYSGRAVLTNVVNTGAILVCEAALKEGWIDVQPGEISAVGAGFDDFFQKWQKNYRVVPEFKSVIADMQTFLTDLRVWLEQVELNLQSSRKTNQPQMQMQVMEDLAPAIVGVMDVFVDKFETIVCGMDAENHATHQAFLRRQLHPLLLCSPFARRAFTKPLGYAGDYEMVHMMMRSPYEGGSLFAKLINTWLILQAPAQAHRNRVAWLSRKLLEETLRARLRKRTLRVFNLGCGPALEVLDFLKEQAISSEADLTLVDFNEETLAHTGARVNEVKRQHLRTTPVQMVKRSVLNILKEFGRAAPRPPEQQYGFIYCAGLFDYLTDDVCQRLMNIFYGMLAPGGLLVATNVSDALNSVRPFRYSMEYILDWHLMYRNGRGVAAFAPTAADSEECSVEAEESGVNLFIEVRKPDHG